MRNKSQLLVQILSECSKRERKSHGKATKQAKDTQWKEREHKEKVGSTVTSKFHCG